ncbi:TPA: PTS transporter subunit EIIC [Streptococcus suis]|uniref:PTS transporter subunit EIIC n=1 Tax=Streptococcus suis TaxID=1307 RepID=UPI00022F9123|nr:PTS transporter subunit EIIC [Streptococcus suis]AER20953.1 phosphotransferase system IIC component, glucose/maltose/N-acetylglucosamine-specific [Streptococcus suis ST1]VTS99021.1 phosphotransferase system IIC component, glucose/maltose/N-acetylglucosamine-specific [Streptococcus suis]HEM3227327.1 PTS transporter subunit EIIC [Streptococcus suis]HEM5434035.1 PTS transporter subunit EIIC [Streptococcus suis]
MNFKKFSQLGQAFMLPISILPVAGLLLGIGGALSNSNAVAQFPVLDQAWLQAVFTIMSTAGSAVFANLALIFAIGVAVGLADADKGTAGLSAGVAYLVYTATISGFLTLFADKGASIDTGVLGALAIGITVATLHNKYRKIELPAFLGFFGGSRFIPIISSFAAIAIGSIFYIIWAPIQNLLVDFGKAIAEMGSFRTFLYGFGLRLTGAFGLHHTIYPMFWYTSLGGSEVVAGETIQGAQNIFFAQLADANHTGLFTYGTRFFAGRFATMIFGLPASCLAMYHAIPKENRKKVGSFYSSSALTSLLTGITEPIEFSFLFVAPWLYVVHAFLDGLSFLVADLLQIRIGNSFSGGLIDYLIFGVFQGNDKTNWIYVIPVGLLWAAVYYLVFKFLVTKFHVLVPGMESSVQASHSEKVLSNGSSLRDNAIAIIDALGGADNIENVTACATRLRVSLRNSGLVDKGLIQSIGATAVLDVKGGIQAIFGGKAILYSQEINQILGLEE